MTKRSSRGTLPFSTALIKKFRLGTPVARLSPLIARINWADDASDRKKAYVFACFSELAYQQMGSEEVRRRYRIFPLASRMLSFVRRRGLAIDLSVIMRGTADYPVYVLARKRFTYTMFNAYSFIVITVRGTDPGSYADWLISLDFRKELCCGFHRGYLREALAALPALEREVNKNLGSNQQTPVYFVGHSLGGAVATLLSELWRPSSGTRMSPYAFAAPRFAKAQTLVARPPSLFVAPDDLIPHLPPRCFGYSDVGRSIEPVPHYERPLSGLQVISRGLTGRGFLATHSIEHYRWRIGLEVGEYFSECVYIDAIRSLLPR